MKKLLIILAASALALTATTGCDIDADLESSRNRIVVGGIYVEPAGWQRYTVDGRFSHFYADIPMGEITEWIYKNGTFHTYLEYVDDTGTHQVDVQEVADGLTKTKQTVLDGHLLEYTETIRCGYSVGNLRIEISRYPSFDRPPSETMWFRTVITW